MSDDDDPGENLVITCVHGTWGRGFFPAKASQLSRRAPGAKPVRRRWFEPESAFRRDLEQALSAYGLRAAFDTFEWSGANSIFERDKAGVALAELLQSQQDRFPERTRVVIAHSHGGNIAMRALHRLRHIDGDIHVITLATPFVEVFFTPGGSLDERTIRTMGLGLVLTLGSALMFLAGKFRGSGLDIVNLAIWLAMFGGIRRESIIARFIFYYSLASHLVVFIRGVAGVAPFPFGTDDPAELVVVYVVILLGALVGWFARLDRGALAVTSWLLGPVAAPSREEPQSHALAVRLSEASSLPAVRLPTQGILVLRGVDDEAALALAAGAIGARLSGIVVAVLTRVASIVLWGTVAIFTAWIAITYKELTGAWTVSEHLPHALRFLLEPHWMAILVLLLFSWPFFLAFAALLCCTFKCVHGRELLHGSVVLDVAASSTPDCLGNVATMTLPRRGRASWGFRHSLYSHPSVGRITAAWLATNSGTSGGQKAFGSLLDGYKAAREDQFEVGADALDVPPPPPR